MTSNADRLSISSPSGCRESAICDVCQSWASEVVFGGWTRVADDLVDSLADARVSRRLLVTVFACAVHVESVSGAVADEYGSSVNAYLPDELAKVVSES